MTAINFPSAPSVNDQFTAAGRTWIWDGTVWNAEAVSFDDIQVAQSQVDNLTTDLASKASTTHATTHASGGSDALTLAQSQVTNLTSDLSGKAATVHTHTISQITDYVPPVITYSDTFMMMGA